MTLLVLTVIKQGGFIPSDSYIANMSDDSAFGAGYYYGISLGLTLAGMITFIKTVMQLKKQDWFKKLYIKDTDERNISIMRISMTISWYITIFGILVTTFFVPANLIIPLLCVALSLLVTYAISYAIFQKIK